MKFHYFPPSTGLLFSSLAMLSLSVKAADNTAKNAWDPECETKTPLDESNKPEAPKLPQEICKAAKPAADTGMVTEASTPRE